MMGIVEEGVSFVGFCWVVFLFSAGVWGFSACISAPATHSMHRVELGNFHVFFFSCSVCGLGGCITRRRGLMEGLGG
jgi:hypothetical protein